MKHIVLILSFLISFKAYSYQLYRSGNNYDINPLIRPYYCLAGGGSDEDWRDGWRELLRHINGGDVLIIREDKRRGSYESWLQSKEEMGAFPRFNSVTILSLDGQTDVSDPKVLDVVNKSELIFFAGGYQNNYFDIIKNTPLQRLIQTKINQKDIALAGTSAGMAIMGDLAFGAHFDSPSVPYGFLTSQDVLLDPLGKAIDLVDGLFNIPHLKDIVLDTHFANRNRQGRLMGFMANAFFKNNIAYDGLGVDEGTAFCFDLNGKGKVFGSNQAYFVRPVHTPQLNIDRSLSWDHLYAQRLSDEDEIDLKEWGTSLHEDVWDTDDFLMSWP